MTMKKLCSLIALEFVDLDKLEVITEHYQIANVNICQHNTK